MKCHGLASLEHFQDLVELPLDGVQSGFYPTQLSIIDDRMIASRSGVFPISMLSESSGILSKYRDGVDRCRTGCCP